MEFPRAAAGLTAAALMLCGCASVIEGETQQVTVNTVPEQGATCVLSNGQGRWTVTTPGSATVHKSNSVLTVTCNKPGFKEAKFYASGKMSSAALVGTFLPYVGILSSAVDGSSGAALNYPEQIVVQLKAAEAPAATSVPPAAAPAPSN